MEHWIIRNRAAKPRCPGCGSYWYDVVTKAAKDDVADLLDVRKLGDKEELPDHFKTS